MPKPVIVAVALIVGGFAIIAIEKFAREGKFEPVSALSLRKSFTIGLMQCLADPGLAFGRHHHGFARDGRKSPHGRRFSFFLAVPTMFGATAKQLWDNRHELTAQAGPVGWTQIAIGSVVSFVVALVVIRLFLDYVTKRGFIPFAVYRIIAGGLALVWLMKI
jgi:undecaprenyl-diphosphatase